MWALLGKYRDEPVPAKFAERVLSTAGVAPAGGSTAGTAPLRVLRGGRALRFAAVAATVVLAVGAGMFAMRREAARSPRGRRRRSMRCRSRCSRARRSSTSPRSATRSSRRSCRATRRTSCRSSRVAGAAGDEARLRPVPCPASVPGGRRGLGCGDRWGRVRVGGRPAGRGGAPAPRRPRVRRSRACPRRSRRSSRGASRLGSPARGRPRAGRDERDPVASAVGGAAREVLRAAAARRGRGAVGDGGTADRLATFGRLRPEERKSAKEGGRVERAILGAVRAALSPHGERGDRGARGPAAAERMLLLVGDPARSAAANGAGVADGGEPGARPPGSPRTTRTATSVCGTGSAAGKRSCRATACGSARSS